MTPTPEQITDWLTENCGRGLPFDNATDLPTALHGLAYVLRQIEGTNTYRPMIGQTGPARSSIRWILEYVARHELNAEKQAIRFEHCAQMIAQGHNISGTLRAERTLKAQHYALEVRSA